MSDVLDLAIRLGHLRAALAADPKAARTLETTIGPPIQADILVVARDVFGPDMRPFKNLPVKATVDYESRTTASGWRIEFVMATKGAWWMGQKGAKPHTIKPKRRDGRLEAPGRHAIRGPVKHPGSRGKGAIDRAAAAVRTGATRLIDSAVDKVIKEAWHG